MYRGYVTFERSKRLIWSYDSSSRAFLTAGQHVLISSVEVQGLTNPHADPSPIHAQESVDEHTQIKS